MKTSFKALFVLFLFFCAWWLLAAWLLPIFQDEAYYVIWGRSLAAGYFDHPPMVAFLTAFFRDFSSAHLNGRLGTWICAIFSLGASILFLRNIGISDRKLIVSSFAMMFFNLGGLALGVLTTPDSGFLFCWILALSQAAAALRGNKWYWLTTGLAVGLGLLSKYIMVVMGPVLLIAVFFSRRKDFRCPHLYAGVFLAFLVFLPNILWNAKNDWITPRFQGRHGLSIDRSSLIKSTALPAPQLTYDRKAAWFSSYFASLEPVSPKKPSRPISRLEKALSGLIEFSIGQLVLWGALVVPIGLSFIRKSKAPLCPSAIKNETRPLLVAATWVPLIFFGALSLFSKIEMNWALMYLIGATPLLAEQLSCLKGSRLWLTGCSLANVAFLVLIILHARNGILPIAPHKDRLLKETHGYRDMAQLVSLLRAPVFADTYQVVSMIRFYQPGVAIAQWPKITRDSEMVRNSQFQSTSWEEVEIAGRFWLVVSGSQLPSIPSFIIREVYQARDCAGLPLEVIGSRTGSELTVFKCQRPIHSWLLAHFELAH